MDSWKNNLRRTRKNRRERLFLGTKHMRYQSMESWTPSQEDFIEEGALLLSVSDTREQWWPWRWGDPTIHQSSLSVLQALTWRTWFLIRMIQWWYLMSPWEGRYTEFSLTRGAQLMWCFGQHSTVCSYLPTS